MSTLIVVFHKPDDDQAGELNDKLRPRGALVDSKSRVGLVQFPDGCLIVCYDDTLDDQIKSAISDKVNAAQPERKILLIHRTTRERSPGIARDQVNLVSTGDLLEGATCEEYSHILRDELYNGLLRIFVENRVAAFFSHSEAVRMKKLVKRFSILKHRFAHFFLPLDIDLQGWKASGFNLKYGLSIVDDNKDKTEEFLEQARKLVYGDPQSPETESIQQLVNETLQLTQDNQKEIIANKWRAVQALLPSRHATSPKGKDESEERLLTKNRRLFEIAAGILKEICDQKLDRVKNQLNANNPFQEWVVGLDEALEALCEALQAQKTKHDT